MHYSQTGQPNLAYILAKLKGKKYSKENPVTYSTPDIVAARGVLARLLADTSRNEVASIREVAVVDNEA